MQGLILAGGRGSRLAADGIDTPKALVEVAGRPQIVNLIRTFDELGCESIICMVREGITVDEPGPAKVRTCRTPSSLHTLVAGLSMVPDGPVFCAMVDTVMPAADWRRLYQGVTERLAAGSLAVLAVTPFVDDELPLYVTRDAAGLVTEISDAPAACSNAATLVTGGFATKLRHHRIGDIERGLHMENHIRRMAICQRQPRAALLALRRKIDNNRLR